MTNPLYERLSDEEWEAAWPSSGSEVEGRSVLERAKDFGVDLTLLNQNLMRSAMERLQRAQQAAASLRSLRQEALTARRKDLTIVPELEALRELKKKAKQKREE